MLISGGKVIAIDSVNTSTATLSGDGVWQELGLNTSAVIDPINNKISVVSGKLDNEIATRTSADNVLSAGIDYVSGVASSNSSKIDYLSGAIDSTNEKITVLSSTVDTVSSKVDTISSNVDTISSKVDSMSSKVDTISSKLDKEIKDRIDDVIFLSAELDAETFTREEDDQIISAALVQEIQNRISADSALSASIDKEKEERIESDNQLSGYINTVSSDLETEKEIREESDEILSAAIDDTNIKLDEISACVIEVSGHVITLSAAIENEKEERIEADNVLSAQIDELSADLDEEKIIREEMDNTLSAAIDTEKQERISADNLLSAYCDEISANLDAETEIRAEIDDILSAAIDTKQDILSAGDNISIDENVVSVSGVKEINLHYPLFGVETKDGLVIGIHDTTRQFNDSYTTTSIANPLSSQISIANGYKIKNNEFSANNNIKNLNLNVTYKLKFTESEDFEKIYSTNFKVLDKDNNEVYVDSNRFDRMNSYSFGLNLKNNSPYKFKIEGDTTAFTGLDMNISCLGTWMPSYDYLKDLGDINETNANQILVWNPTVLGVSDDEILGIDEQTAIEV